MEWLSSHSGEVLRLTVEHMMLCGISVLVAVVMAVPLGIWIHGRKERTTAITVLSGILYTIPSLALFAMLVPVVGLGRVPAIAGLVAYGQLILVRGVMDSLDAIDENVRDAAVGMGIPREDILVQVDIPLAIPVFLSSLRIATVTIIGIATIGAVVDAGGLGELILSGIQRDYVAKVVIGGIMVTVLALAADFGLLRLEKRLQPWAVESG